MVGYSYKVIVSVTAEDIAAASKRPNNCPQSKALKRQFKSVEVSPLIIVVDGQHLMGSLLWDEWFEAYWAGDPVEPMEFELRGCRCGDCVLCRFNKPLKD